jgi:hypothetical protein
VACFGEYGTSAGSATARERTFRMESICFDRLACAADEPQGYRVEFHPFPGLRRETRGTRNRWGV